VTHIRPGAYILHASSVSETFRRPCGTAPTYLTEMCTQPVLALHTDLLMPRMNQLCSL